MSEELRPNSWNGHISNKIRLQASALRGWTWNDERRGQPPLVEFESLGLPSSRRLFQMNNVSPVVEKILGYSVTRGDHTKDTMTLSASVLFNLMSSQPDLFAEMTQEYGLDPEQAIKHCVEYMRLHDAATLSLQGAFHGRLTVGNDVYHEDKALLGALHGDENYNEIKEILFDDKTVEYYRKEGIMMDTISQIAEDSINGKTLLGRMLKKGIDCASFDWIAYTLRDFSEMKRIFNIAENQSFSEQIDSVMHGLQSVTEALEKGEAFNVPKTDSERKNIQELLPADIVKLVNTNEGLRLAYDADILSKIYTMHMLLRMNFSGAPWLQGTENTIFSLFSEHFKDDPNGLLNLLLTSSEEEVLRLIKKDLDLTQSKKINLMRPASIPSKLKGWRYSTIPKEGRIRKKFTFKDVENTIVENKNEIAIFSDIHPEIFELKKTIDLNTPLFLQKRALKSKDTEIEFPSRVEQFRGSLKTYAEALYHSGRKNLLPMLDKETEKMVFAQLEQIMTKVLDENEVSSQPNRGPDSAKKIREKVETLMELSHIKKLFNVRIIEPETLYGLHAPHVLRETQEDSRQWALTDIGTAVLSLKKSFLSKSASIFMVAGRARDATGMILPGSKRIEKLDVKTCRLNVIRNLVMLKHADRNLKIQIPQSDFDFVVANGPDMETIAGVIRKSDLRREYVSVKVNTSSRRPFSHVDVGYTGHSNVKGGSIGEFFYPSNRGNYRQGNGMLPSLMEDGPRADIPILLIPHFHKKEGKWMLWGMALDFFGGYEDVSRHRLENQSWLDGRFATAYYPFPEQAFISGSPRQDLYRLRYAIRSWGWGFKHPIITLPNRKLSEAELDDPEIVAGLSKETQVFMTEKVIYPLADKFRTDKYVLGYSTQRLKNGISLLTDIAIGLDGDPVATLLRMLPAGFTLTKSNKGYFATNTNIYGFGFFDERGFFPEIGKLLKNPKVRNKLTERIFDYLKYLETPVEKRTNNQTSNRKLFFDFLFELAEGDATLAFDLLRPVWCDEGEWGEVNNSVLARSLIKLDERFNSINYRWTIKKREISQRLLTLMQG